MRMRSGNEGNLAYSLWIRLKTCLPVMSSVGEKPEATGDISSHRMKWTSRPCIQKTFFLSLRWLAITASIVALYWAIESVVKDPALPGGQLFAVELLLVAGAVAAVVAHCAKLPRLLGPLVVGVVLASTGVVHLEGEWAHAAAVTRKVTLVLILLRAGLGLDAQVLMSRAGMLIRLALVPSAAEMLTVLVTSRWLLHLPWMWGGMTGAMTAAVSPAVVVPTLFRFQEQGLGVQQGVPSLVVGAAAIDTVIAVVEFETLFALVFTQGNSPWKNVLKSLLALPLGVSFGLIWGILTGYLPSTKDSQAAWLRSLLLLSGGMVAVLGGSAAGFNASGPIAAPISAFVASIAWLRRQWPHHERVKKYFQIAWIAGEVLVFALIGAEVDVTELKPMDVGLCTAVLTIGISVRFGMTMLVTLGGGFTWKEKLFLALAWFPKATTQAALGPAALEASKRLALGETAEAQATQMLTLAALAILLTAPLGAVILDLTGPRLLRRQSTSTSSQQETDNRGESNAETGAT